MSTVQIKSVLIDELQRADNAWGIEVPERLQLAIRNVLANSREPLDPNRIDQGALMTSRLRLALDALLDCSVAGVIAAAADIDSAYRAAMANAEDVPDDRLQSLSDQCQKLRERVVGLEQDRLVDVAAIEALDGLVVKVTAERTHLHREALDDALKREKLERCSRGAIAEDVIGEDLLVAIDSVVTEADSPRKNLAPNEPKNQDVSDPDIDELGNMVMRESSP